MSPEIHKGSPAPGIVLPTALNGPFRDIRITGLLEERCYVVQGSILRIYLQLSHTPPLGWAFMFTNFWRPHPCLDKPRAGFEDDAIWIECVPEELAARYFTELEKAVEQANAQYRPSLEQKAVAEEEKRCLDEQALSKVRELRHSLKFSAEAEPAKFWGALARCGIGIAMTFFCVLWCIFGVVASGGELATVQNGAHGFFLFTVWLGILLAGAWAALSDFKRALKGRGRRDESARAWQGLLKRFIP